MTASRPEELGALVRTAGQMEQAWLNRVPHAGDARYTPWMPFSIPAYIAMVTEALPEIRGDRFLEIGSGIGTKLLLAREFCGFSVLGIERTAEYAAVAGSMGLETKTADALDWAGYDEADLTWFNRVFRDLSAETALEAKVWAETAPGAVIMCANLESRPPMTWYPVLDSWDSERRGIWQKPFAPAGS